MKSYILILLLFTIFYSCFGQRKKDNNFKQSITNKKTKVNKIHTDTTLTLLTYGLPDFERQNSENVVSSKWKISFYPVAGCVVTQELEDSVKTNNDKVRQLIEKKYGINWEEKFNKEVDEEFEREKLVTTILDSIDFIKKKDEQMNLEGNGLHYYMTPIKKSYEYNVSVDGWWKINKKSVWVSYYRMTINYKTKKYKLLDDKIEILE